jgi:tetratricopeptide (TPR) repeat protein
MSLDPQRLKELFLGAAEITDSAQRQAWLGQECGQDLDLLARVQALLEAREAPDSFLDVLAPPAVAPQEELSQTQRSVLAATVDDLITERPGTVIGPYKLLKQIGEGGMGTVFMAEQTHPVQRKVALKIIKPGLDSAQVIGRFEAERQALALMEHPNIAKVFDAGTTLEVSAGRPYFVMELVRGVPLTRFCDDRRLTPKERLELFIPVCQAVQHAHQKGIIHRDLKPSNVLVALYDGKPVPKVIDFSVAKATGSKLTDKTLFTGFGAVIGTLEYMSPEQAEPNQLDIDTRSDIYSLGVLLYELLTGTTPLERKRVKQSAMLEVLRLIREEEPPKPSARLSSTEQLPSIAANRHMEPRRLTALVRGELDWIVMKALEKDRNRRYETANGLAMDLQRYLTDEPVSAGPPSAAYRLRKFARRHKAALSVAGLVLFFIVSLGIGVGWVVRDRQAREAEIAHDREVREAALESEVTRALNEAGPLMEQGKWPEALAAVERAGKLLASTGHTERPPRLVALQKELTMAQRLDDIYRGPERDFKAEVAILGLAGSDHGPEPQQVSAEEEFFSGRGQDARFAKAFQEFGIDIEAHEPAEAAARIARTNIHQALLRGLDDWAAMRQRARGDTDPLWKKLVEIARQADSDEWRKRFREALLRRDRRALEKLADGVPIRQVPPATPYLLGQALWQLGALDKAAAVLREAHRHHPDDFWLNDALGWFSKDALQPPRYEDALRYYMATVVLRPRNPNTHRAVAEVLQKKGAPEEAIAEYSQTIELDPKDVRSWHNRAHAHQSLRQWDRAIADFSKSVELDRNVFHNWACRGMAYFKLKQWEKAAADISNAIELKPKDATLWVNRGYAYKQLGEYDKALADVSKAIKLDPKGTVAWSNRGWTYCGLHEYYKAIADFNKAIELDPKNAVAWSNRGWTYHRLHQYDKAIADMSKAIELDPKDASFWDDRGNTYYELHQYDKAVADLNKTIELDPKKAAAWSNRGRAYRHLRQYDKAVADLNKAIELDPKNAAAWSNRGAAYHELHVYDKAVADYTKAIELDPKNVTAWGSRGWVYRVLHQYNKALADMSKAIELDPKNAAAWNNRGSTYTELGQYNKALADLDKAIELAPKEAMVWNNRGQAYYHLRQYDKALAHLNKAIELDPKLALARNLRGRAYFDLRQWEKAIADLNIAIELDPKVTEAWNNRGHAYYHLRQYDKAIADLNKAIELDPKLAEAWNSRGMAYIHLHQYDKGLADLSKAIELKPKLAAAWNNRGTAYRDLRQYDKALADLSMAVELEPNNPIPWTQRGFAYSQLGAWSKALGDYSKALDLQPDSPDRRNHLAWLLATCPESKLRDPKRAVELAQRAAKSAPKDGKIWTTLGAARYRSGDWKGAAAALREAENLFQRASGFNAWLGRALFFQAMAQRRLGNDKDAHQAHDRATQWLETNRKALEKDPPLAEELLRFRAEAAEVLGLKKD